MAIDPGVEWGWALFRQYDLVVTGVVKPPTRLDFWERVQTGNTILKNLLTNYQPSEVVCEWPNFQGLASGGRGGGDLGDIGKLHFIIGNFARVCQEKEIPFFLAPVTVWKGNLPKDVVNARLQKILPEEQLTGVKSHAWDAVGIGVWRQGRF